MGVGWQTRLQPWMQAPSRATQGLLSPLLEGRGWGEEEVGGGSTLGALGREGDGLGLQKQGHTQGSGGGRGGGCLPALTCGSRWRGAREQGLSLSPLELLGMAPGSLRDRDMAPEGAEGGWVAEAFGGLTCPLRLEPAPAPSVLSTGPAATPGVLCRCRPSLRPGAGFPPTGTWGLVPSPAAWGWFPPTGTWGWFPPTADLGLVPSHWDLGLVPSHWDLGLGLVPLRQRWRAKGGGCLGSLGSSPPPLTPPGLTP